jgi:hypothetical protein
VGVDDEAMYDLVPPASQNTYATVEPFDEFVHVEVEVDDVDPLEINVLYDPENPK